MVRCEVPKESKICSIQRNPTNRSIESIIRTCDYSKKIVDFNLLVNTSKQYSNSANCL